MPEKSQSGTTICVSRFKDPDLQDSDLIKDFELFLPASEGETSVGFGAYKMSFGKTGVVYVKQTDSKVPAWQKRFFKNQINAESKTCGAALIVRVTVDDQPETYAVTFGVQGRFIVNSDLLDDRFGLKTALCLISSNSLKQIEKNEITGSNRITLQQISAGSGISSYEVDPFGDYLKSITGSSSEESGFQGMIKGAKSLSIKCDTDINGIKETLIDITKVYRSESYKKEFDWIDNLYPITNKALVKHLFELAIEHVNNLDGKVWFAVPEIVNIEKIGHFRFSRNDMDDVDLEGVLEAINGALTLEDLESTVLAISNDDDSSVVKQWKLKKCLCGEVEYEGAYYGISDGKWFSIKQDYAAKVDYAYQNVELYDGAFPKFDEARDTKTQDHDGITKSIVSEAAYLERLSKSQPSEYVLMDQDLVSGLEVCDLVTANALIHVKRYRGSASMSHAFFQGLNSTRMIISDSDFVNKANGKIRGKASDKKFTIDNANRKDIVFAIITKDEDERPHLPLFSKISLTHTMDRLKAMDYHGKLAAIHVE